MATSSLDRRNDPRVTPPLYRGFAGHSGLQPPVAVKDASPLDVFSLIKKVQIVHLHYVTLPTPLGCGSFQSRQYTCFFRVLLNPSIVIVHLLS